jgi:hypothetical protein
MTGRRKPSSKQQRVVEATRAYLAAVKRVNAATDELHAAAADYIEEPDDDQQQTKHGEIDDDGTCASAQSDAR